MAKETDFPPFFLFLASAILTYAAWWMPSFPMMGFVAFAPLFALTDRVNETSSVWEKMEWVLLSLTVSFFSAHHFDTSYLVSSMFSAILFTLPFVAHVWVRQTLGPRAGKITILLFWLALEYLLLKVRPAESVFLANMLQLKGSWMHWSGHTGYLAGSLWILVANLFVYEVFLSRIPFRWPWIVTAALIVLGPLAYSFYLTETEISRQMMIKLYEGNPYSNTPAAYLAQGEWIVRTATWISALVLLFTLVKSKVNR